MVNTRHGKRVGIDEVSLVLGDARYAGPHCDKTLRDVVLGPHSRDLVPASRYYMLLRPPVVVDFEPPREDGPFFPEEKRRYFMERGIAYVAIHLRERLTMNEFAARVREARRLAEVGPKLAKENVALRSADPPPDRLPPGDMADLDRLALRLLEVDIRRQPNLRGASRMKRLAAIKRRLISERRGEVVAALRLPPARPQEPHDAGLPRKVRAEIGNTGQATP